MLKPILTEFTNKKILICLPHPDDELYISGILLQELVKNKNNFHILCLTKGGAGKNYYDQNLNIKEIRTNEFYLGLDYIGVRSESATLLDFDDGNLKNISEKLKIFLDDYIEQKQFEVLISFDNSGITGHPDHITISSILFEIGKERNISLFIPTLTFIGKLMHFKANKIHCLNTPTHEIKGSLVAKIKKYIALNKHTSQHNTLFHKIYFFWIFFAKAELFHKINPQKSYNYEYTKFKI